MSVQDPTDIGGVAPTLECPRDDCDETFTDDNALLRLLAKNEHLALDHDPAWEEVDGYPRPESER